MKPTSLTLLESDYRALRQHLFPSDGCEAVAIALCGIRQGSGRTRLLVKRIVPVPYSVCTTRSLDRVTWPTDFIVPLLVEAEKNGNAIVKFHGHRGYDRFS